MSTVSPMPAGPHVDVDWVGETCAAGDLVGVGDVVAAAQPTSATAMAATAAIQIALIFPFSIARTLLQELSLAERSLRA